MHMSIDLRRHAIFNHGCSPSSELLTNLQIFIFKLVIHDFELYLSDVILTNLQIFLKLVLSMTSNCTYLSDVTNVNTNRNSLGYFFTLSTIATAVLLFAVGRSMNHVTAFIIIIP